MEVTPGPTTKTYTTTAVNPSHENLHLFKGWYFNFLHKFMYQIQGFCQVRIVTYATAATAAATAVTAAGGGGHPQVGNTEALGSLGQNRDMWTAETVSMCLRCHSRGPGRGRRGRTDIPV